MTEVRVSRGFLIVLATVAAGSLLALAFVLGRESGSSSAPSPITKVERVAPSPREAPTPWPSPAAVAVAERPQTSPAPTPVPWPASASASPSGPIDTPAAGGGARAPAASDPERAAVAAYFEAVEKIQAGSVSGEPERIAQEMASALASGDSSSLDTLIRDSEAARARIAALTPPAACAAHHRESVASLDDALEVLRALKAAMQSSDPVGQLGAVSARAQALQSRADALQGEERALRERYGLKR